jgi:DNA-binding FrmR family transcriptional regulator
MAKGKLWDETLVKRLKRIEEQIRGIQKMILLRNYM